MATSNEFRFGVIDPRSAHARSVGLARQVMSADLTTRGDGPERGVRCVALQNDVVSLDVIVDRGLDIGAARIRQMPVSWNSPTGVVAPWLIEPRGDEFLRGFFGGLLTTCGLDHIGPPADRSADRFAYEHRATEFLPMHGRFSGIPARLTGYGVEEAAEGLAAYVAGTVAQVAVFGKHLTLSRRISIGYGSSRIVVADTLTNEGYASSPLAMMYHVNIGWPVVSPGAAIEVSGARVIGDDIGPEITPPIQGAKQKVCIYAIAPDGARRGHASIINPDVDEHHSGGASVSWDADAMPSMVRWQVANTAGHYVLGLEPCTGHYGRDSSTLEFPALEPGEARTLGVAIELSRTRRLRHSDRVGSLAATDA